MFIIRSLFKRSNCRVNLLFTIFIWVSFAGLARSQVDDNTNIDPTYKRSWPADPYSEINTEYGVLMTRIPLIQLGGKGNTGIEFSIYHRSNQAPGTQFGVVEAGAGRGFTISPIQSAANEGAWYMGANSSMSWARKVRVGDVEVAAGNLPKRIKVVIDYLAMPELRAPEVRDPLQQR